MELHIKDRLIIPGLLPEKNNFMDFNLKKAIINKVSLSEQEKKDFDIKSNDKGNIEWNAQKDAQTPLCVDFSTEEQAYLKKACEQLSENVMQDDVWSVVEHIYNETQN